MKMFFLFVWNQKKTQNMFILTQTHTNIRMQIVVVVFLDMVALTAL